MKTIYKYGLQVEDTQSVLLPQSYELLHVGFQDGGLFVWCSVDTKSPMKLMKFRIVGTGHPFEDCRKWSHIGSCIEGGFVWHVFVETAELPEYES